MSAGSTEFEVVIEIPRGSRNKYEVDHETGHVWLDRRLFTAMAYPADYGYIANTLGEDGDPLDVLVLLDEPTFPGCHLHARAVGVFWMRDDAGPDAKVLAVPSADPRSSAIQDLEDLPPFLLGEIRHFFEAYKELEPGKFSEVREWQGRRAAEEEIRAALQRAIDTGYQHA
ncbi:MAG: inorganic diphosphatase [Microthrixaceae bacterium]|nr:inorganic diphosphatase [Microthrixaceae bacterium]